MPSRHGRPTINPDSYGAVLEDEGLARAMKAKKYRDREINPDYFGKVVIGDGTVRRVPDYQSNWLKSAWLRLASWIDNRTTYVRSNDLCAAGWTLARSIETAINGGTGYMLVNRDHLHRLLAGREDR